MGANHLWTNLPHTRISSFFCFRNKYVWVAEFTNLQLPFLGDVAAGFYWPPPLSFSLLSSLPPPVPFLTFRTKKEKGRINKWREEALSLPPLPEGMIKMIQKKEILNIGAFDPLMCPGGKVPDDYPPYFRVSGEFFLDFLIIIGFCDCFFGSHFAFRAHFG